MLARGPLPTARTPAIAIVVAANLAQQRLGLSTTVVILEYLCGATNSLDPYSAFLTPDNWRKSIRRSTAALSAWAWNSRPRGRTGDRPRDYRQSRGAGGRAGGRPSTRQRPPDQDYTTDQAANLLQGPAGTGWRAGWPPATRARWPLPADGRSAQRRSGPNLIRGRASAFAVDLLPEIDPPRPGVGPLAAAPRRNEEPDHRPTAIRGGLLISSVDVADLFLPQGVIVIAHAGRIAQEDSTYSAHEEQMWGVPLTLIIDRESASAAEIFSRAIRDHHRGRSSASGFGKGSGAGHLPGWKAPTRAAADDGQVLFAHRQALQRRGRRAG